MRTEFEHRRCEVRSAGGLIVDVEGERYRIEAGDVKALIFSGRPESKTFGFLPLRSLKPFEFLELRPFGTSFLAPCGAHARFRSHLPDHRAGQAGAVRGCGRVDDRGACGGASRRRAVVIRTRAGTWIVPLVSFRRVARGEAVSAPLFPLMRGCLMRDEVRRAIGALTGGGYMM